MALSRKPKPATQVILETIVRIPEIVGGSDIQPVQPPEQLPRKVARFGHKAKRQLQFWAQRWLRPEANHASAFERDNDFAFTIDGETPRNRCRRQRLFPKQATLFEAERDNLV